MLGHRIAGRRRCAHLMRQPRLKLGGRFGHNKKSHVRMLMSAELGALASEGSFLISLDPERIFITRNQIAFSVQVGRPEAVNHILRRSLNHHRLADWNMDLIRSDHGLISLRGLIADLPPPLMADDLDADWIF